MSELTAKQIADQIRTTYLYQVPSPSAKTLWELVEEAIESALKHGAPTKVTFEPSPKSSNSGECVLEQRQRDRYGDSKISSCKNGKCGVKKKQTKRFRTSTPPRKHGVSFAEFRNRNK